MKNYEKLLIVMLCIAVITSILSLSVCAEEQNVIRKGTYTTTGSTGAQDYNININFVSNGVEYVKIHVDSMYYTYYETADGTKANLFYAMGNVWQSNELKTIEVLEDTIITNNGAFNWFNGFYERVVTYCDGSTCPATDMNYDNICDDCGAPFTFNLRNDTYSYNGYYLPSAIEDESGTIVNLNNYWHETLSKTDGNLVILNAESTDNALLYHFSPDVVFIDGQVVTTGKTEVTLYKPSTNENGYLYWKKSATDTWNTSGALVASVEHIDWVANAITDENGYTAINGDVNFQTPLWVEIQGVTEGEMTLQLPKMGGTMKILVVCGVGLMACLVVLSLFGKRSLIFRN